MKRKKKSVLDLDIEMISRIPRDKLDSKTTGQETLNELKKII